MVADHYPELARLVCAVSPGETDDVVTSPYNAALSLYELRQHATCVVPVCNNALSEVRISQFNFPKRCNSSCLMALRFGQLRVLSQSLESAWERK